MAQATEKTGQIGQSGTGKNKKQTFIAVTDAFFMNTVQQICLR
jgi:hypothetical protein